MESDSHQITALLHQWRNGDRAAAAQVMTHVYGELRRLAKGYMGRERVGHTLQPTALVHELYLRLFAGAPVEWRDRAHLYAVAAQQLRRILIDHARRLNRDRHGGGQLRVSISEVADWAEARDWELVALDDALRRLEELDPRAAQVVELRFFGGLTEREAAEVVGTSVATLKRDWDFSRTWLLDQLTR
jgi:RNA polymerase sigma factor (TIGR02999 family)